MDKREVRSLVEKALIRDGLMEFDEEYIRKVVYRNTEEYLSKQKSEDIVEEDKVADDLDSEKCGKSSKYIAESMSNGINKFNNLFDEYEGYVKEIDEWYSGIRKEHDDDWDNYEKTDEGQQLLGFRSAVDGHYREFKQMHDILNYTGSNRQVFPWGINIKDNIDMILNTDSYSTTEKLLGNDNLRLLRQRIKEAYNWYSHSGDSYGHINKFEDIKKNSDITNVLPGFDNNKKFLNVIEKLDTPLNSIQGNVDKLVDKLHINVDNPKIYQVDTSEDVGYALEGGG